MKTILIKSIIVYQKVISPILHQLLGSNNFCRSNPTCSSYAKEVIMKYGAGKGLILSLRRILNCQPLFSL